jgi:hypothetical protein
MTRRPERGLVEAQGAVEVAGTVGHPGAELVVAAAEIVLDRLVHLEATRLLATPARAAHDVVADHAHEHAAVEAAEQEWVEHEGAVLERIQPAHLGARLPVAVVHLRPQSAILHHQRRPAGVERLAPGGIDARRPVESGRRGLRVPLEQVHPAIEVRLGVIGVDDVAKPGALLGGT